MQILKRFSEEDREAVLSIRNYFILALVALFSSFPWSLRGMNWSDFAFIFHYANKLIHGYFPYKDYVFNTGILPIVFDYLSQKLLGERYLSSLVLALFIKFLNVSIIYAIFSKLKSRGIGLIISTGFAFSTPLVYDASYFYSDLFLCISFFFIILAEDKLKSMHKRSLILVQVYFCSAAFFVGLNVLGARQSTGILSIFLTLISVLVMTIRNPQTYFRNLFIPWLLGLLIGIAAPSPILLLNDALPTAMHQLFLDAGEKKSVGSLSNIIDALTGGLYNSNIYQDFSVLQIMFSFILSFVVVGFLISLFFEKNSIISNRLRYANSQEIGFIVLLTCFFSGMVILEFFRSSGMGLGTLGNTLSYDIPRIFFTILFFLGLMFKDIFRKSLGLSDLSLLLILSLVLSSVWSLQLSWPGRGYISVGYDLFNFMIALLIMMIMASSPKVKDHLKNRFSVIFFLISFSVFIGILFGQEFQFNSYDGSYFDNQFRLNHPMASLVKVSRYKSVVFDKLRSEIKPDDSCFVYGSAQVLYTLLDCKNPTRIDNMFYDNYTLKNAQEAVSKFDSNPPKWIIENVSKDPVSIDKAFDGSPYFYGPFNQMAPKVIHTGLRRLIKDYRLVFTARELFPAGKSLKSQDSDGILDFVLYKHK
jgi:hypothetical protein